MSRVPLFVLDRYLRVLALVLLVAVLLFAADLLITGDISNVDMIGASIACPLAAYLIHLWVTIFRGDDAA